MVSRFATSWLGKQSRLRGFRHSSGFVTLRTFAGKPVSVQPGFPKQTEGFRNEGKLMLRKRQAASVAFHGSLSGLLVGRKERTVPAARVIIRPVHNLPARVLPNLAAVVPMKAKLREFGGDLRWLLAFKLNPNPLANDFGQFPKARGFLLEQRQQAVSRQTAISTPFNQVNLRQCRFAFTALCGPVLEL
jgi:hypothetical protein